MAQQASPDMFTSRPFRRVPTLQVDGRRAEAMMRRVAETREQNYQAGLRPHPRMIRLMRVVDCIIAMAVLIPLALPMLLIAAAIRLDTSGPVLFRQIRLGKDGRPFVFLKFRTMCHQPGQQDDPIYMAWARQWLSGTPVNDLHRLTYVALDADQSPASRSDQDGSGVQQTVVRGAPPTAMQAAGSGNQCQLVKLKNNPRVTRIGRILRKTSLDELPQLFNVLAGDMSIVGPRPCTFFEAELYPTKAFARLYVNPGITGLWQVAGRGVVPFDRMVDLDLQYVTSNTLGGDLLLILSTIPAVLSCRGAV
jgi:lipopolysaccharide/colanic/teichoic acid biosynthesis glycosyltransferase